MEGYKMKKPIPIDKEIVLDPRRYIVSETDEKGRITFCNDYFMEVSVLGIRLKAKEI
jgi:hypothetical protein